MTEIVFCSTHHFFRWINSNQGIVGLTVAGIQIWLAWWAVIKPLRQSKLDRDNSVLDLLKSELEHNYPKAKENLAIVKREIEICLEQKEVIHPLIELTNASKVYFFSNIPESVYKNSEKFSLIQKIIQEIEAINGLIRHREMYKLQNGAMSNFSNRLKMLDENMLGKIEILIKDFEDLTAKWNF